MLGLFALLLTPGLASSIMEFVQIQTQDQQSSITVGQPQIV
jgi:hypothetical protein